MSHSVRFGRGQDHFPAIRLCFWMLFFCGALWFKPHAEQPQHRLPACPLCSFVVSSLANEPPPSPSPAQILAAAAFLQPDPAPFGPGCPETAPTSFTPGCQRVGLCPAGDLLQKVSTRRSCFLQPSLNFPKEKRLMAESAKAGFWIYVVHTIILEQIGLHKVRRCIICSDIFRYQTRHPLLFHRELGSGLVLSKLCWYTSVDPLNNRYC